jgi:hypothetical protein
MIGGRSNSSMVPPYVLDDSWEGQRLYGGGVLAQRLDPALEARISWG